MLDWVNANLFITCIAEEAGASKPLILSVNRPDGEQLEAYVKISDRHKFPISLLVVEALSAVLAADLELPVPEPLLVRFTPEFIDSVDNPEVHQRLKNACSVGFGTRSLPSGSSLVPTNIKLNKSNRQDAAEILAFDALIDNPDRGGQLPVKNNCLIYNDKFYIFDHEKAFQSAIAFIIGAKERWTIGGLDHLRTAKTHLFINQLQQSKETIDFTSFKNRWKKLSDERLKQYIQALPSEWSSELGNAEKIIRKLTLIRDNIEGCISELQRILG